LLVVALLVVVLGRARTGLGRWLALAGVVTLLLWVPPLIQQVTGHPGNLGQVAGYFTNPPQYSSQQAANIAAGPAVGWNKALGVMGTELTPPGPWLTGDETGALGFVSLGSVWPAVLVLLAAVGAGLLAWRRGAHDAARLAGVVVVLALLGLVATSRITGILAPYLVRWWWVVTLLIWLAIGWCLVAALGVVGARAGAERAAGGRSGLARLAPAAGLLAAAGALALVTVSTSDAQSAALPNAPASVAVAHLAPSTARAVGRNGPDLLSWNDPETLAGVGPAMFTALRLAGMDVVAGPDQSDAVGAWRTAPPVRYRGMITGVGVPDPTMLSQAAQPPPGSRLVASYDPLSPRERQEAVGLQRRIRAAMGLRAPPGALVVLPIPYSTTQLVDGGASRSDVLRLKSLQARGSPYLVYFTPGPG
jgi:hypothetical protein